MRKYEKQFLLDALERNDIEGAKKYLLECRSDFENQKLTAKERNYRWAKANEKGNLLLDIAAGENKVVKNDYFSKKTLSVIANCAYPDRKYKFLKFSDDSYLLVRVK